VNEISRHSSQKHLFPSMNMQFHKAVIASLLSLTVAAHADLLAAPKREVRIEGDWKLNVQQSDDAQGALAERLQREHDRMMKMMRDMDRRGPLGLPPPDAARDLPPPSEDARAQMRRHREREEEIQHRFLAISDWLRMSQGPTGIELSNAAEQRHVEPGTRSQVSMPGGELADERVGWDGETLVISRDTRDGPDVVEKFRWLKASDQLEYRLVVSGDSELAGIKLKRVYDRNLAAPALINPVIGPVK
jgi:hypothetical protein